MKYPEIAKRFNRIMNLRGLKAVDLAEKTGISKASISQYVNGNHSPSNDTAQTLGNILRVNPLWLMGFEVDMEVVIESDIKSREQKFVDLYNQLTDDRKDLVDNMLEVLLKKQ